MVPETRLLQSESPDCPRPTRVSIIFFLHTLDLICSFASFLKWKFKLLILDISFQINVFSAINFPVTIAFATSHKFQEVVFSLSFNSKYF